MLLPIFRESEIQKARHDLDLLEIRQAENAPAVHYISISLPGLEITWNATESARDGNEKINDEEEFEDALKTKRTRTNMNPFTHTISTEIVSHAKVA